MMRFSSRSSGSGGRARDGAAPLLPVAVALLLTVAAFGCKGDGAAKPGGATADLVARGKAVYGAVCMACHNLNPKLDGALGPSVVGASLELLRAKVLENKYPPGYKPKRATSQMVPLPQVKADLEAIAAFLDSVK